MRAVFQRVAREAAPRIADLLLRAEAARKGNDPASLTEAGPPRIYVPMVRGAPGDGNRPRARRGAGKAHDRRAECRWAHGSARDGPFGGAS